MLKGKHSASSDPQFITSLKMQEHYRALKFKHLPLILDLISHFANSKGCHVRTNTALQHFTYFGSAVKCTADLSSLPASPGDS